MMVIKYYAIFPTLFKLIMDLKSLIETGIKLRRIVSLLIPANLIISYIKPIRPRTPRHNGKVERSHRNDNNRFYQFLTFSSLQDLNVKGAKYLKHSNNICSSALGFLTPLQKRFLLIFKHIFFLKFVSHHCTITIPETLFLLITFKETIGYSNAKTSTLCYNKAN